MAEYAKPDFAYYFKFSAEQIIKAFIFFLIVGFLTYPAWKSFFVSFNFFHMPLVGLIIIFGIIILLFVLGFLYSIYKRIISLFAPGK